MRRTFGIKEKKKKTEYDRTDDARRAASAKAWTYKTCLCKHWDEKSKICPLDECTSAHGREELRCSYLEHEFVAKKPEDLSSKATLCSVCECNFNHLRSNAIVFECVKCRMTICRKCYEEYKIQSKRIFGQMTNEPMRESLDIGAPSNYLSVKSKAQTRSVGIFSRIAATFRKLKESNRETTTVEKLFKEADEEEDEDAKVTARDSPFKPQDSSSAPVSLPHPPTSSLSKVLKSLDMTDSETLVNTGDNTSSLWVGKKDTRHALSRRSFSLEAADKSRRGKKGRERVNHEKRETHEQTRDRDQTYHVDDGGRKRYINTTRMESGERQTKKKSSKFNLRYRQKYVHAGIYGFSAAGEQEKAKITTEAARDSPLKPSDSSSAPASLLDKPMSSLPKVLKSLDSTDSAKSVRSCGNTPSLLSAPLVVRNEEPEDEEPEDEEPEEERAMAGLSSFFSDDVTIDGPDGPLAGDGSSGPDNDDDDDDDDEYGAMSKEDDEREGTSGREGFEDEDEDDYGKAIDVDENKSEAEEDYGEMSTETTAAEYDSSRLVRRFENSRPYDKFTKLYPIHDRGKRDKVYWSVFSPPLVCSNHARAPNAFKIDVKGYLRRQKEDVYKKAREEKTIERGFQRDPLSIFRNSNVVVELDIPQKKLQIVGDKQKRLVWNGTPVTANFTCRVQDSVARHGIEAVSCRAKILSGRNVLEVTFDIRVTRDYDRFCRSVDADNAANRAAVNAEYKCRVAQVNQISSDILENEWKRPLGSGHFGDVFQTRWNGRDVAVKVLKPSSVDSVVTEIARDEFRVEMQIHDMLSCHDNVVSMIGANADCKVPFMVMDYYENGALNRFTKNTRRNKSCDATFAKKRFELARGAMRGLLHVHDADVLHRDVAPRNFLVCNNWNAHISDFGLSLMRPKEALSGGYFEDTTKVMPVRIMAPQAREDYLFSKKSDVWAAGLLLWDILSEDGGNSCEVARVVSEETSSAAIKCPKDMPSELFDIICKCWHKDAKCRPDLAVVTREVERYVRFAETGK